MKDISISAFGNQLDLTFHTLYKGSATGLAEYRKANAKTLTAYAGVYIYVADNGDIVYIGKAQCLNSRMREHNKEMLVEEISDKKLANDTKWVDAFSQHRDRDISLLFAFIDDETDRIYIEQKLQRLYNSQFAHKASQEIAHLPVSKLF